jgi:hypothetical protein
MEEQDKNQPQFADSGFASIDMMGLELHEIYLALQRAGFDKKEALYIIGVTISNGAMSPYKFDDSDFGDMGDDEDLDPLI